MKTNKFFIGPIAVLLMLLFGVPQAAAQYAIVVNGPAEICGPNSTYLSVSNVAANVTIRWYKNNPQVPGLPFFVGPILQSPATGYWTAEVINNNGPVPQSVFTSPVLIRTNMTYIESPFGTSSCSPITIDENASYVANLALYDSYQWKKNGINISGANNFTYAAASSGVYTCQVQLSCGTGLSNSLAINIDTPPTYKTISANGPLTFCDGGSVSLSISPTAGLTYQWIKNGVDIQGATAPSYIAATSGTYNCKEISANCGFVLSSAKTVTVNPKTIVNIIPISSAYNCLDAAVNLAALPSGGVFSGQGVINNQFNPNLAGVGGPYPINYDYTNTFGCSSNATIITSVNSNINCAIPQNVSVGQIAKKTAKVSWNSSSAPSYKVRYRKTGTTNYLYKNVSFASCSPTSVDLSGLISNTSYTVDVRAVCTSGSSAYSNPITFKTLLSNPVPIASRTSKLNDMESETDLEEELQVYPNPFNEILKIEAFHLEEDMEFSVRDLSGREIEFGLLKASSPIMELQTTNWEKGIFILTTKKNGAENHIKLIKN